jgi:tetratricopeptide (TPR) repeat protein
MLYRLGLIAVVGLAFLHGAPLRADGPAEKELFDAIRIRLEVKNLFQIGQVIAHCQKALELGLPKDQEAFCKKMLVAALVERATLVTKIVMGRLNEERRKLVRDDLEQAVKVDPTASAAHLLLAELHVAAGDHKAAVAALTKLIDVEKAQGEKGDLDLHVQALQLRAKLTDDPKQKTADLEQAIKLSPDSAALLLERAQAYLVERKFEAAQADGETALRMAPKGGRLHAQALALLGMAQAGQNKLADALKSFDAAIDIQPLAAAYLGRGRIYLRQGKGREALDDINKLIAGEKATADLLLLRATAHQLLKDSERAVKDAESALKLDPDDDDVMLQVGLVYYQAKRNAKAVELFTALLEKDPKNAGAYAGRADTYLQTGDHAKAIGDYQESLKHDADSTHVLNNLAWVLATSPDDKVRDGRRSIELAKKACELTSYKEAHIVSTLAAGYAETGDFETAIKWSKKAVELGEGEVTEQLKKELASYEAKKPWREKFGSDEKD